MYINTNVSALFAENALQNTQNTLSGIQQEMSTGYQINSPANNPSGLAISNLMQGEIGGINSAINNATQASNLLNVANGGMQTDVQIVQQIQQLAVQASNGTNNSQDTQDIQSQINQLLQSLDNVAQTLNYNNQAVLNQGPSSASVVLSGANEGANIATSSTGFMNGVTIASAGASVGTYTVSETYTATYSVATSTSAVSGSVFLASVTTTGATAGTYSVVETGTSGTGFTVSVYQGSSLIGTTTYASTATTGTYTVSVGNFSLAVNLASTGTNTQDFTITGHGTYVLNASYGTATVGTATVTTTFTSGNASTGTSSIALGSLTVGFNLASVPTGVDTTGTTVTQALTISQAVNSLTVGADSGGVAAGLYSVTASYNSATGVDTVQVTNSAGSIMAYGSVANLSSTGNVELQLVSGQTSSGPYSFVLNVNQSALSNLNGASAVTGITVSSGFQYNFQTGPNQGNGNSTQTQFGNFTSTTLGLDSLNVNTNAQYAVSQAKNALSMLTNAQGAVGAQLDQINYTLGSLQTETTNLQASRSAILDANMAKVTSQFAQEQILMQTGIQALQTSQQLPSLVLKLLG